MSGKRKKISAKPVKGAIAIACDTWKEPHFRAALQEHGLADRITREGEYCPGGFIFHVRCIIREPAFKELRAAVESAERTCQQIKAAKRAGN